ncbi:MAG: cob(I)alamin adenosyltransferase [Phycisphaerales bacterium]|jgi:cob(I)alamin adenosyltransferase
MVKLTKIYTRSGDSGTTGLGPGTRVPKDDARVEAYGEVDEANCAIGLAVIEAAGHAEFAPVLVRIQNDLFDVGADLCTPIKAGEDPAMVLRIHPHQTERLEREIDRFNEPLAPLKSFVLPGGTRLAAALHLARTITRRAERRTVTLHKAEPEATSPETVKYLNRLSDLLFVLARAANADASIGGQGDVLWVPGQSRDSGKPNKQSPQGE